MQCYFFFNNYKPNLSYLDNLSISKRANTTYTWTFIMDNQNTYQMYPIPLHNNNNNTLYGVIINILFFQKMDDDP